MREIEKMLKIIKSIIDRYIKRLGLVKNLDIWIPHELKEIDLITHINENDYGSSVTNHHKQYRKQNCIKKSCNLLNILI